MAPINANAAPAFPGLGEFVQLEVGEDAIVPSWHEAKEAPQGSGRRWRTEPRHPTRDRVNPRTLFFRPLQAPTLASVVDLVRSIELLGSVWPPHQCGTATETAAASSGAKMKIPDSNRSSRP